MVKLKAPSYLMLGMVRLGARSGYAIKKATDRSTRGFWPTSLAQVYPELGRLERAGLLRRSEDPRGARQRSVYEVTEQGEAALSNWLRSAREAPLQLRDEGLLKLFFADALPREDQLTLVRRQRERAQQAEQVIREEMIPLAEAQATTGARYPAIAAQLGADMYAYARRWFERLEQELTQAGQAYGRDR